MAPRNRRTQRSQPAAPERWPEPRLEELREASLTIIERALVRPYPLPSAVREEAGRIRGLYAPLFRDLQERVRAAESLEEVDDLMIRVKQLDDLVEAEMRLLEVQATRGEPGSPGTAR